MSIYLATDGEIAGQVASNKGWGDLCRWAESLDGDEYAALQHLCGYGWCEDIADLSAGVKAALEQGKPDKDVATVALEVLSLLDGADVVTITDGLMPADGSDEEADAMPESRKPSRRVKHIERDANGLITRITEEEENA